MRRVARRVLAAPFKPLIALPIIRRVAFHGRRIGAGMDLHFFRTLTLSLVGFVVVAAGVVSLLEESKRSLGGFGDSLYWAVTTVIGSGDASYVESPGGQLIGWLLAFFGVAIVAALTAAIVGFVIDFLLKEGQGMGASGYQDHIVVCGWNSTARELIDELSGDEFPSKVVLLHETEHNPAGMGVYFVRGDVTSSEDLGRAGIAEASAAIVFPADTSNDADMRSILTVLAIESLAPHVRTVVEVNNPRHVEHFQRAHADEILVTSQLASRLLARSALPGPGQPGHRHRVRRRRIRALPRRAAGGLRRPQSRRALGEAALGAPRHPARRHPRRGERDQPAFRLPADRRGRRSGDRGVSRRPPPRLLITPRYAAPGSGGASASAG